ncbi:hypothetical protein LY76DRAFT_604886 [Colletotrichum caudatum]|nr:hypothetical protein LY76DRAFT_604886 [Colletotrichum caudatum]
MPNDTIHLSGTTSSRFEKRPRHKTREGRYDTPERVRQRRKKGQEERQAPPHSSLPRKISSSGREVMDNFRSGVILNDRLTSRSWPSIRLLLLSIHHRTSPLGSISSAPKPSKANGEKGS